MILAGGPALDGSLTDQDTEYELRGGSLAVLELRAYLFKGIAINYVVEIKLK
jgi:hypothetical protein